MADRQAVMRRSIIAALVTVLLASCVAPVAQTPVPAPRPTPVTVAPPAPAPSPAPVAEGGVEPGVWTYARTAGGSVARFGQGQLAFECRAGDRVVLVAATGAGSSLTLRASTGARTVAAAGGVARIAASDAILDALAFSRGRFAVGERWYPAWPEVVRVVEDCRA